MRFRDYTKNEFIRLKSSSSPFFAVGIFFMLFMLLSDYLLSAYIQNVPIFFATLLSLGLSFSCFLGIQQFFEEEADYGFLDLYLAEEKSLSLFVASKILVWWGLVIFPFLSLAFFYGKVIGLPLSVLFLLALGFTPLSLLITSMSCFFAGILLGIRQSNLFLAVLVLPLLIPILILGSSIALLIETGVSPFYPIWLLWAMAILGMVTLPALTAILIKKTRE